MVELLAPAKNIEIGMAAINCGADAVYIGAPQFSARQAAGNTIQDIEQLVQYAHLFNVRVLVALNTILTDSEIDQANRLIWELYNIGVDALIIQDLGLLETDLPPIRLHASTQCHNTTVEHLQWLEKIGFSRAVLARELSIEQIQNIRQQTSIELEVFVHGALCVSYSGQCYMSEALRHRSANRGECAQMCRLPYDLLDADQNEIIHQKHLLSLFDMDRSKHLQEIINAGVTSLKIEGRLKDINYVKNIVSYYRHRLDSLHYTSDISISFPFEHANPEKTFHRSQTDYFLHGRSQPIVNLDTPKSTGEHIGYISQFNNHSISLNTSKSFSQGDGLCVGSEGFMLDAIHTVSQNPSITSVSWSRRSPFNTAQLRSGMAVYRNYDRQFNEQLTAHNIKRKRPINISITHNNNQFQITISTLDNISVTQSYSYEAEIANNPQKAFDTIRQQISKVGDTIFTINNIDIQLEKPYFIPISIINQWRREICTALTQQIIKSYQRLKANTIQHAAIDSSVAIDYHANIYNHKAQQFYHACGAEIRGLAFESTHEKTAELMRCKYCIKYEMGWCKKHQTPRKPPKEPLYLRQGNDILQLHFDCKKCEMVITR